MLTLANFLTFIRLMLVLPGAYVIFYQQWSWAAGIFVVAVVTDIADGRVARHRNQSSAFGGLFDHATDALFVAVSLASFALNSSPGSAVPVFLPVLIVLAFIQYVLDSQALAGQSLRMSKLGRYNGIAYFVLLGTAIALELPPFEWISHQVILMFSWSLVLSTLFSMADRAWALLQLGKHG